MKCLAYLCFLIISVLASEAVWKHTDNKLETEGFRKTAAPETVDDASERNLVSDENTKNLYDEDNYNSTQNVSAGDRNNTQNVSDSTQANGSAGEGNATDSTQANAGTGSAGEGNATDSTQAIGQNGSAGEGNATNSTQANAGTESAGEVNATNSTQNNDSGNVTTADKVTQSYTTSDVEDDPEYSAIIAGHPVENCEHKWYAYVLVLGKYQDVGNGVYQPTSAFRCGGSLVAEDRVLTAAHCFVDLGADAHIFVHLGNENSFSSPEELSSSWQKSFKLIVVSDDELYFEQTGGFEDNDRWVQSLSYSSIYGSTDDVGVLYLDALIARSECVDYVKLATYGGKMVKKSEISSSGLFKDCEVVGHGLVSQENGNQTPNNLNELSVEPQEDCNVVTSDNYICATSDTNGGICNGDSGSFMVCKGVIDNAFYQIGIVHGFSAIVLESNAKDKLTCDPEKNQALIEEGAFAAVDQMVYANVAEYEDFIKLNCGNKCFFGNPSVTTYVFKELIKSEVIQFEAEVDATSESTTTTSNGNMARVLTGDSDQTEDEDTASNNANPSAESDSQLVVNSNGNQSEDSTSETVGVITTHGSMESSEVRNVAGAVRVDKEFVTVQVVGSNSVFKVTVNEITEQTRLFEVGDYIAIVIDLGRQSSMLTDVQISEEVTQVNGAVQVGDILVGVNGKKIKDLLGGSLDPTNDLAAHLNDQFAVDKQTIFHFHEANEHYIRNHTGVVEKDPSEDEETPPPIVEEPVDEVPSEVENQTEAPSTTPPTTEEENQIVEDADENTNAGLIVNLFGWEFNILTLSLAIGVFLVVVALLCGVALGVCCSPEPKTFKTSLDEHERRRRIDLLKRKYEQRESVIEARSGSEEFHRDRRFIIGRETNSIPSVPSVQPDRHRGRPREPPGLGANVHSGRDFRPFAPRSPRPLAPPHRSDRSAPRFKTSPEDFIIPHPNRVILDSTALSSESSYESTVYSNASMIDGINTTEGLFIAARPVQPKKVVKSAVM